MYNFLFWSMEALVYPPFILLSPFAIFVLSVLYFSPLPRCHTYFPLLGKLLIWPTLVHFLSLGIEFSWRITLQQIIFVFPPCIRCHFIMVPRNFVLTPDIGLFHLFSLPALPASLLATWEQRCSSFFIVLTPVPGIMFGTW